METSNIQLEAARALPKNMSAHPSGLLLRIRRGEMVYCAIVPVERGDWQVASAGKRTLRTLPADHPSLVRACEIRDRFVCIAGPVIRPVVRIQRKANSNTGHVGISETVTYRRGKPYDCFIVGWSEGVRRDPPSPGFGATGRVKRTTRFYFRSYGERGAALRRAVEFRREKTGKTPNTKNQTPTNFQPTTPKAARSGLHALPAQL